MLEVSRDGTASLRIDLAAFVDSCGTITWVIEVWWMAIDLNEFLIHRMLT